MSTPNKIIISLFVIIALFVIANYVRNEQRIEKEEEKTERQYEACRQACLSKYPLRSASNPRTGISLERIACFDECEAEYEK